MWLRGNALRAMWLKGNGLQPGAGGDVNEIEVETEIEYIRNYVAIPTDTTQPRSAGPQEEGALMCSKSANLGPAQQSSAGLLHFERW